MKNKSLFGLMVSLAVVSVGSLPVQSQNRTSSTNTTTQPQVPTWRQFVARGGGRYIQVDYDLPTEYRDGFVYFNQGASVINAFILKKGLSSYPPRGEALSEIDFNVADKYIESGKAIQFNWNLGNSSLRYANDTEVRFPNKGTGCFRANCLTAPFFSNAQISRILRSKRRISQSSPIMPKGSTNTKNQNIIKKAAQSSREIKLNICSESKQWVRPTEKEQLVKVNSIPRLRNLDALTSSYWKDNIFLFRTYGLNALTEPIFLSGLWSVQEDIFKCYEKPGIIQKINSGEVAEIWLLQHKIKRVDWQDNRYVIVVEPKEAGVQFIQFHRVERHSSFTLKVVRENGQELATLISAGSQIATGRLNKTPATRSRF